jgi:putative salt-induced outer membrane protein
MKKTLQLAAMAAAFASGAAFAQDKPDGQWHGNVNLGASFASAAVTTTSIVINADTTRKTADDKLTFYGVAQRGDTKVLGIKAVTTDLYRAGAKYDRDFNKQLFGFVGGELEKNGVTDLTLRSSINAGLGMHVIATPETTFDVFGGLGYNHYKFKVAQIVCITAPCIQPDGTNGSGEALIGEESSHKLSETTTAKQKFVVYKAFDSDLGYRATFDSSLGVAMGGGWNMNLTGSLRYANKVYVVKKTESLITVGFGYKF